jgi:hypothetical protein
MVGFSTHPTINHSLINRRLTLIDISLMLPQSRSEAVFLDDENLKQSHP